MSIKQFILNEINKQPYTKKTIWNFINLENFFSGLAFVFLFVYYCHNIFQISLSKVFVILQEQQFQVQKKHCRSIQNDDRNRWHSQEKSEQKQPINNRRISRVHGCESVVDAKCEIKTTSDVVRIRNLRLYVRSGGHLLRLPP